MIVIAEGDARLILIVDSCALIGRMPSIKQLGDLVRAQHGSLVQGQNLSLTVKLLIPYIATRELDAVKDDRTGTLPAMQGIGEAVKSK